MLRLKRESIWICFGLGFYRACIFDRSVLYANGHCRSPKRDILHAMNSVSKSCIFAASLLAELGFSQDMSTVEYDCLWNWFS